MLINDSVTVAVEVPVFLTQEDIRYYRSRGFELDFESEVITGHIASCRSATDTFTSSTTNRMHAKKRTPTCN